MNRPLSVQAKDAGFTLIEVLMSLLIIGMMTGAVVLSLPSGPTSMDTAAGDIARAFEFSAQRSLTENRVTGVRFREHSIQIIGYEEPAFDDEQETPVSGISAQPDVSPWQVLHAIEIPRELPIDLTLSVDGTAFEVPQKDDDMLPLIVFAPDGVATPFVLTADAFGQTLRIEGDTDGAMTLVPVGGRL